MVMVLVQYPSADNAVAPLHHSNAPLCQMLLLPQFYLHHQVNHPIWVDAKGKNYTKNVLREKMLKIEHDLSCQWENIVPELGFLRTFAQKLAPKSL